MLSELELSKLKTLSLKGEAKALFLTILIVATLFAISTILSNLTYSPLNVVESGSMEPTLRIGDLVIAFPTRPEDIALGDIIIFKPLWARRPVIHRVVDKAYLEGRWIFQTKGDAVPTPDPGWITEDQVVAKMAFSIPLVGIPLLEKVRPITNLILLIAIAYLVYTSIVTRSKKP